MAALSFSLRYAYKEYLFKTTQKFQGSERFAFLLQELMEKIGWFRKKTPLFKRLKVQKDLETTFQSLNVTGLPSKIKL